MITETTAAASTLKGAGLGPGKRARTLSQLLASRRTETVSSVERRSGASRLRSPRSPMPRSRGNRRSNSSEEASGGKRQRRDGATTVRACARTSKADTTAPRRRAVPIACSPATPAPSTSTVAGREVPAAESKWQIDWLYRCVEIAARGYDDTRVRDHERAIELREFLDRAAEIWISDVSSCRRVPSQRVENEGARCREHGVGMANCKQGSDAPALSPLAGDLECELHRRLEHARLAPGNLVAQFLNGGDRHCIPLA